MRVEDWVSEPCICSPLINFHPNTIKFQSNKKSVKTEKKIPPDRVITKLRIYLRNQFYKNFSEKFSTILFLYHKIINQLNWFED